MKIDWKLKGFNLLKFNCNKDQVVHPETCSDMVLMGHDGEVNLTDWIKSGTSSIGENLASWIDGYIGEGITIEIPYHQYSGATSGIELGYFGESDTVAANRIYAPYGSNSIYGVFRTGYGLTANDGTLNLNTASTGTNGIGGVKIGYNATGTKRALLLNNNGEAYVDLGTITSVPPTYFWTYESDEIKKLEDTPGDHDYALKTSVEFSALFNDERYNELVNASQGQYTYPVGRTSDGILFTYVVPTVYYDFNGNNHGLVPANANANTRTNQYLNGVGSWVTLRALSSSYHNSSDSYVIKGPGTGTGWNTKFLKGDGTWDTPTNTTYDIATENNKEGLLQIINGCHDTSCDVVEPSESQENIVPVVYNTAESKEGHGVVLEDIVDAISKNTILLRIIAKAMADDKEENGCVSILRTAINS